MAALAEEQADMTMLAHTHERTAPTTYYTRRVDLSAVAITGILLSRATCLCPRRPWALAFTGTLSTAALRLRSWRRRADTAVLARAQTAPLTMFGK